MVRVDRVDDPPMVTPVGFDDDSDTACTQFAQDMAYTDASSHGGLARNTAPEGPGRDDCREHDEAVVVTSA